MSEENLVAIEEQNQQTLIQGAIRRNMVYYTMYH